MYYDLNKPWNEAVETELVERIFDRQRSSYQIRLKYNHRPLPCFRDMPELEVPKILIKISI